MKVYILIKQIYNMDNISKYEQEEEKEFLKSMKIIKEKTRELNTEKALLLLGRTLTKSIIKGMKGK